MKLSLIDIDALAKDLPEIKSSKVFELRRKFSKHGLFSQQIFGPTKSYHCDCNKNSYKGSRYEFDKCPLCGVDITTSDVRKKRFAKIELPFPILNPLMFFMICGNRSTVKKIILEMISYKGKYYFDEDVLVRLNESDPVPEGVSCMTGLTGALEYINLILGTDSDKEVRKEIEFARNNRHLLTIQNILVIPPEFRPVGKLSNDNYISDDVNEKYLKIIKISNDLKNVPCPLVDSDSVFRTNFWYLQKMAIDLYDYILERMSKKTGLIRSNILGKRVDFSGRSVISPDPTLSMHQCRLPYWMVLEILKPQLITHFVNRRVCKRYNQAAKLIDDSIKDNDSKYFKIVKEFCKGKICVLNRQPTLHRLSALAFEVDVHLGNTIQIHPMVCPPYNADFDGDAMAVYFPITEESIKDVKTHLGIWNNLISPTDIDTVPKPNQDIILGIYSATRDDSGEMIEYKNKQISRGKYLFNKCLPEDYPVIDYEITEKKLKIIIDDISLRYKPSVVMNTMDEIKNLGFSYSTMEGHTLGIDDLYYEELEEIADKLNGDLKHDMDILQNNNDTNKALKKCTFSTFIDSGARGSWGQAKQIVLSRGYVADANNKVRPNLIRSSLVKGLNPREFFDSCWGSRKGLLDTALSTGDTGYLTRQLIYSTAICELGNEDDCGTTDTLDFEVKDAAMAKTLLWRWRIKENGQKSLITHSNYKDIVGKVIKLRTPIYCKSKKLCKTCYGNLHKILHSDQVGIIATQAIGERATQLVLKTFHISGAVQGNTGKQNEDIISGMYAAKKLFHNPRELGDINSPVDLLKMIYDVFGQYGGIHMIHFEVIVSSMMWSEDKLWRLLENRNGAAYDWVSILQIPSKSSWLLGCAFSNLKQKLIAGVVDDDIDEGTALTSLFRYS